MPPEDTGDDSVRILSDLGLVSNIIIGDHFTSLALYQMSSKP